ncbi:T9SS type A sorting domain-containing protein [Flammeovirgaceae bacterium SG7u.111]|nr:T9SS type A sorting domain-containing protein [Flammeovirgaceae bacterium SG7u.132]WPO35068.1 T9SS type A sorting domain-containing protein [Flammeovirgaceae bacterium SG7u.111]
MKQIMNSNLKRLALLMFSVFTVSTIVFAQPKRGDGRERNEELRKEMKEYFEENILPEMKTQREKLDQILTNSEKKQVEELRVQAKVMKEEKMAKREDMRGSGRPERGELTEAQRAEMQQKKREQRQLMTQAWAILDNHADEVDALVAATAEDREQWRNDMKAIKEKHLGERGEGRGMKGGKGRRGHGNGEGMDQGGRRGGHGGSKGRMGGGPGGMMGKEMMAGPMFLLWDVNEPFGFGGDKRGELGGTMVSPNPGTTIVNIDYTLKSAGNVKITLHDRSGELVETIIDTNQLAGDFTEQLNIETLSSGVYIYKITTTDGTETKRFIKR